MLRRLVAGCTGADQGDERGLAFTDYSSVGEICPFVTEFHAKLYALPLSSEQKAAAVAEADAGFKLNIALTDEFSPGAERSLRGEPKPSTFTAR